MNYVKDFEMIKNHVNAHQECKTWGDLAVAEAMMAKVRKSDTKAWTSRVLMISGLKRNGVADLDDVCGMTAMVSAVTLACMPTKYKRIDVREVKSAWRKVFRSAC